MAVVSYLLDDAGVTWEDITRQGTQAEESGLFNQDETAELLEFIFTAALDPQYVAAAKMMRQKAQHANWRSYRKTHERKPPPPWPQGDVADTDLSPETT